MNRILLILLFVILLAGAIHAVELKFDGAITIDLERDMLNSGDEINATITVANTGDVPIAEAYLVVELVSGEYYYPSQKMNSSNVFYEAVTTGINLAPNSFRDILFSHTIPGNLRHGVYRLDAYLRNEKTYVAGVPHLFESPTSAYFRVSNAQYIIIEDADTGEITREQNPEYAVADYPQAVIWRTETKFNGEPGPIGVFAEPDSVIDANLVVKNQTSQELTGLQFFVGMCVWDDISCDGFIAEKTIPIDVLEANEKKTIKMQLTAPTIPDAYAIRLELTDSSGELLSLYRSRVVVGGATKKIRKLYADDYYFEQGETVKLTLLVAGSPDHYNGSPVLYDSELNVVVTDLQAGETVFEDTIPLEPAEDKYLEKTIEFIPGRELSLFEVCGSITKDGTEYDSYCFTTDSDKFIVEAENEIILDWSYSEEGNVLSLEFCAQSLQGIPRPVNADYYLLGSQGKIVSKAQIEATGCISHSIEDIKPKKYSIVINNQLSKKQKTVAIDILAEMLSCENRNCDDNNPCTVDACSEGACSNQNLPDGGSCGDWKTCSHGQCMEVGLLDLLLQNIIPAAVTVALFLILYAGYIYYYKKR